jgi:hypothetical protein
LEQVCIKDGATKTETVRWQLDAARKLLADATAAAAGGECGADRWLEHHADTVRRLTDLLALLEDPTIPEGTMIQLGGGRMASAVRAAADKLGFKLDRSPVASNRRRLTGRRVKTEEQP